VARLAGLPEAVIARSKKILLTLENNESERETPRSLSDASNAAEPVQMFLFGSAEHKLREHLKRLDLSQMTPIDALNLLHKLSEEAKK